MAINASERLSISSPVFTSGSQNFRLSGSVTTLLSFTKFSEDCFILSDPAHNIFHVVASVFFQRYQHVNILNIVTVSNFVQKFLCYFVVFRFFSTVNALTEIIRIDLQLCHSDDSRYVILVSSDHSSVVSYKSDTSYSQRNTNGKYNAGYCHGRTQVSLFSSILILHISPSLSVSARSVFENSFDTPSFYRFASQKLFFIIY